METQESWHPVVGHEEKYEISDLGRVASLNYRSTGVRKVLTPGKDSDGYLKVCLQKNGRQISRTVHSMVLEAFAGPRPKSFQINHKSGIKTDNRLSNLEYCTSSQNRLHAYALGLQPRMRGESHPNSKLDSATIIRIRRDFVAGERQSMIAKTYGIHPSTVSMIVNSKRWAYVL